MTDSVISIGCIGGSGSRLIARIVQSAGYHIGDDLNVELDNLWVTLLFKRLSVLVECEEAILNIYDNFKHRMMHGLVKSASFDGVLQRLSSHDRILHSASWLAARRESFLQGRPSNVAKIAWKEPNTHIFIDHLLKMDPALRYIHITRNGLDMAYSSNLNQLRLWGAVFLHRPVELGPRDALSYWVAVERRIRELRQRYPDRIMIVSYEALAFHPKDLIADILHFCGEANATDASNIAELINPVHGIDRHKAQDLSVFRQQDIDYARAISAGDDVRVPEEGPN